MERFPCPWHMMKIMVINEHRVELQCVMHNRVYARCVTDDRYQDMNKQDRERVYGILEAGAVQHCDLLWYLRRRTQAVFSNTERPRFDDAHVDHLVVCGERDIGWPGVTARCHRLNVIDVDWGNGYTRLTQNNMVTVHQRTPAEFVAAQAFLGRLGHNKTLMREISPWDVIEDLCRFGIDVFETDELMSWTMFLRDKQ